MKKINFSQLEFIFAFICVYSLILYFSRTAYLKFFNYLLLIGLVYNYFQIKSSQL